MRTVGDVRRYFALMQRFDSILKECGATCVTEAVVDHFEEHLKGDYVHVLVYIESQNRYVITYVEPEKVRWLFDAYST